MEKFNLKGTIFTLVAFLSIATIMSCGEDDPSAVPVITISGVTLNTDGQLEAFLGDVITFTVNAEVAGGFKSATRTIFSGTTQISQESTTDEADVTNASDEFEVTAEYIGNPIRINYEVEDLEGQTSSGDLIIIIAQTPEDLLLEYSWQWKEKIGKILETDAEEDQSFDCEKDNIFTFNSDGTMCMDYGTLTQSGGGTCDFDGLDAYKTWALNDAMTVLTLTKEGVFGGFTDEVYNIQAVSTSIMTSKSSIDLTELGGILSDWTFTYTPITRVACPD